MIPEFIILDRDPETRIPFRLLVPLHFAPSDIDYVLAAFGFTAEIVGIDTSTFNGVTCAEVTLSEVQALQPLDRPRLRSLFQQTVAKVASVLHSFLPKDRQ